MRKGLYVLALFVLVIFCGKNEKNGSNEIKAAKIIQVNVKNKGVFEVTLYSDSVKLANKVFSKLINEGYYNNKKIYAVGKGMIVVKDTAEKRIFSLARSETRFGFKNDSLTVALNSRGPLTVSPELWILVKPHHEFDGINTVIGKVSKGAEVLYKIKQGDEITISIIE